MPTDPAQLHEDAGVFDAHSDILYAAVREHRMGTEGVVEEQFLPEMRAGGIDMRVAPIYRGNKASASGLDPESEADT